jgi:hypothetical protein
VQAQMDSGAATNMPAMPEQPDDGPGV